MSPGASTYQRRARRCPGNHRKQDGRVGAQDCPPKVPQLDGRREHGHCPEKDSPGVAFLKRTHFSLKHGLSQRSHNKQMLFYFGLPRVKRNQHPQKTDAMTSAAGPSACVPTGPLPSTAWEPRPSTAWELPPPTACEPPP